MAASDLHEMTLSEIVTAALRLYGDTVLPAVPIALAANLPLLLVSGLSLEPGSSSPAALAGTLAVIVVATGLAVSAITRVLLGAAAGTPVAARTLPRLTVRRSLISVTLAYALTSFLANAGLLMLVLPGLLLGGLCAATLPAVLVERLTTLPAMGRSLALMRVDLLKAMAAFAFGVLISELLPVGLMLALQVAVGPSPFSPLLAVMMNGLTLPVALAVNVTLYSSARMAQGMAPEALQSELARAAAGG
jgi:hypothetical protein